MQVEQAEVQIRLTVDVTYSLNGETAATMAALLPRLCEQAIGDGMLTGDTSATVESHEVTTKLMPALMSEEAVADAWAGRSPPTP